MRRASLAILATAAAIGVSAAPAAAAGSVEGTTFSSSSLFSIAGPPGATHVRQSKAALAVRGTLSVAFGPDPASGCAALAGCAYSGTIVYKPSGATLLEVSYRLRGHLHREATVILVGSSQPGGDELYTRVSRTVAGASAVCADTSPGGGFLSGHLTHGRFDFSLVDALSSTRCAGPLPSDLAGALPVLRLAVPAQRGARADLRRTASFAAHGFAGTVASTLQFAVGRSSAPDSGPTGQPPGSHTRRIRYVQRSVSVSAETGTLTFDVRGTSDGAVCILLDSCGLTGRLTVTPGLRGVSGALSTGGPARRPKAYYVRVLSGRGPRLSVDGALVWERAGTLQTRVRQSSTCTDTAPVGAGEVLLSTSAGHLQVQYGPQGYLFGSGPGGNRSRCPGPHLGLQSTLASGSVPRAALRGHTATVVLHAGAPFQDDGYAVTPHGQVTLTLRFGRITQKLFTVQGP